MYPIKEQLPRLIQLDKYFQKGQQWKLSELLQKLAIDMGIQIGERTLKADLSYLATESQGILINKKIGREWFWFYTNADYSLLKKSLLPSELNALQQTVMAFKEWGDLPFWEEIELMLKQFETRFVFDNRPNRKLIDFQKPISIKGNQWLKVLYESIDNQKVIKISYSSLRTQRKLDLDIYPYLLKEYNNRWWLIGWSGKNITNIALETITDVQESAVHFSELPDFDPKTYFDNVLGVTVNPGKAETIRLRVAPESVEYLRTKPIHHLQREEDESGTIIILKLIPNFELMQAILQYGSGIEVLEPKTFRDTVYKQLFEAAKMYSK